MIDLHLDIDIGTLPPEAARKKINDINFVARHFVNHRYFEHCRYCVENALMMAEAVNYSKGIANAKYTLGLIAFNSDDYENAIGDFLMAAELFRQLNEPENEGDVYSHLGICYRNIDDYTAMIDVFFKALNIYRECGNKSKEGNMLNSIGNYYLEVRQEALALEYYAMTLQMKKKELDIDGCIRVLFNIGLIYNNLRELDKSLKYYLEALNFNRQIEKNPFYEVRIMQNIASVYRDIQRYDEAEKIYNDCIEYYNKTNNLTDKCDTLQCMAALYARMGNSVLAEKYFEEAENLALKLNSKRLMMLVSLGSADHYAIEKNFKNALHYRKKYAELNSERNKTIELEDIKKLNILHKVDITKKETQILTEKNQELNRINNKLLRLNEEKNYFLGLAANDLKIPLEKITNNIAVIRENENQMQNLSEILDYSSQMQKIIAELLAINETEAAKIPA